MQGKFSVETYVYVVTEFEIWVRKEENSGISISKTGMHAGLPAQQMHLQLFKAWLPHLSYEFKKAKLVYKHADVRQIKRAFGQEKTCFYFILLLIGHHIPKSQFRR